MFRLVVVATTASVHDSVLCLRASSSDCFCTVASILEIPSCFDDAFTSSCDTLFDALRLNSFRGKVGVSSDSSVLLNDVRWDTVPDMVSNPSSLALSLLLA